MTNNMRTRCPQCGGSKTKIICDDDWTDSRLRTRLSRHQCNKCEIQYICRWNVDYPNYESSSSYVITKENQ